MIWPLGLENPLHIALLLLIIVLVFGAKRVPELGRSLGEGIRGFKQSISGEDDRRSTAPTAGRASAAGALEPPNTRDAASVSED